MNNDTTPWQLQVFALSIRKKEKWEWASRQLASVLTPQSRCLDVGSGVGTLSILQERMGGHWEFTETDRGAAHETKAIVKGPVHTIDIFDAALKPASYDLITIFDVIEHVPDPQQFMHRVTELLKPGGTVILTTPADDGTFYFWRRLADSAFGIDKAAHGHVVEGFSRQQLIDHSRTSGLTVKACEMFSFFFTEMVELMYNAAYIVKNRRKQKTAGYNLALSPASGGDVSRHKVLYTLLKITYPILRAISRLDHVLPVRKGYEWGLVATKQHSSVSVK